MRISSSSRGLAGIRKEHFLEVLGENICVENHLGENKHPMTLPTKEINTYPGELD